MHYTVNRDNLKLLLDDVDELAEYIEQLIEYAYNEGYERGRFETEEY